MSATRDKSQKIGFVYSNLYEMYRKGKEAAASAPSVASSSTSSAPAAPAAAPSEAARVLKSENLGDRIFASVKVKDYRPAELLAKRIQSHPVSEGRLLAPLYVQKPEAVLKAENPALQTLKDNLKALNDLHSRLRFMLKELEELVKE